MCVPCRSGREKQIIIINTLIHNLKKMKKIHSLLLTLSFLAVISTGCGNNSAKAQVLAGTKDITIQRLDEIVDSIMYGLSANDKIYSNDFGTLLKEYENPKYQGNGVNLELPGELFLDFDLIMIGIGGEEMTKEAKRQYETLSFSDNEAVVEVSLHQDFGENDFLDDKARLCLIKEKGIWNLDDIMICFDDKWSPRKESIKRDIIESVSFFQGRMLDEYDPRPFKMVVVIDKYPDEDGRIHVWGIFKFDNNATEDWYYMEDGSIQNGDIFVMIEDRGMGGRSFSWTQNPDSQEIRDEWQAYNPGGRLAMDKEFVMSLIP